jgi:hypothetical protein
MYRLLSLPSEAETANRAIGAAWDYADPPDFDQAFEERQWRYAKLGLAAFAHTQELRRKYTIPTQELGDWNPVEHLTKAKEGIEATRKSRGLRIASLPTSL